MPSSLWSNRRRRATTSAATSDIDLLCENAWPRSRRSASPTLTSSWTEIIPAAWCTTARRSTSPAQSTPDTAAGGIIPLLDGMPVTTRHGPALQMEEHCDTGIGERNRLADLGKGERAAPVPVQVEHAEGDSPDLEREREGGRDAGHARSGGERRPSRVPVQREIGAEHRLTQPRRVHAGALPQFELEVLHLLGVTAGGGEDSCAAAAAHQRQADPAHRGGLAAFLDQPFRP